MKKLLIIASMLFALLVISCNSEDMEEQALQPKSDKRDITHIRAVQLASDFLLKENQEVLKSSTQSSTQVEEVKLEKVIPIIGIKGKANLYIVKNTIGFAIISGTSKSGIILASSINGSFDEDNLPPAFEAWLDNATKFIDKVRESECKENEYFSHELGELVKSRFDLISNMPDRVEIRIVVEPKLKYNWSQGSPFNLKVPRKWSVGCGPLAVGMIIRFNEYANSNLPYRNWDKIKTSAYNGTQDDRNYRAEYLNFIRTECKATSNPDGSSGTLPSACLDLFKKVGYTNAKLINIENGEYYKLDAELRKGYPIMGVGYTKDSGHAFVVQGLREYFDMRWFITPDEPFVELPYHAWFPQYYINWGWGGSCNGWFETFDDFNINPGAIINLHQ
jgi:hypothetical protein